MGELLAHGAAAIDGVAVVRDPAKVAGLTQTRVQVRQADYGHPQEWAAALAGIDRLLLVSSIEAGQRVAHHSNVIHAETAAGTSRIVYTSILNADNSTNPVGGRAQGLRRALRDAGIPFTVLRNGWYTENYTSQIGQYRDASIVGGDLETTRQDLAQMRGHPATCLTNACKKA